MSSGNDTKARKREREEKKKKEEELDVDVKQNYVHVIREKHKLLQFLSTNNCKLL
jgi:hypothetical protein